MRNGMSKNIGLRVDVGDENDMSEEYKSKWDAEISRLLSESYSRVLNILTEHKEELDLIASELKAKKTLYRDEIKKLIEDHLSKITLSNL